MWGRRASALGWALTVLMSAAAGVLLVLGPGRPLPDDLFGGVAGAAFIVLSLAYATVGALIASLMAEGLTNTGIAKRLVLRSGTVEAHVRHVLLKLGIPHSEDDHRRVLAVLAHLSGARARR